jgi:UDP-N-acetylglucosamine 2-epimerase (non-hydrolysing)
VSESLYLWKDAQVVLTDSSGLQEETTALGVPCVTIRENTEWKGGGADLGEQAGSRMRENFILPSPLSFMESLFLWKETT